MTFLRWAGSKKQILPVLSSCWYAASVSAGRPVRYIEGFSGSASLFFHLKPRQSILVDVNSDLQRCLKQVQKAPKGVSMALKRFEGGEAEYYRVRAESTDGHSPNAHAARFIYLNRFCFNGLYRTNSKGQFNVPFGGSRTGYLPDYQQLLDASRALSGTEIIIGDFCETILPRISKTDFLYFDPPFAMRNADLDNQYGPDVFGTKDIARLKNLLMEADRKGAKFLVSYAECEEIYPISSYWHHEVVEVRRTIAANTSKRGLARELLITNI